MRTSATGRRRAPRSRSPPCPPGRRSRSRRSRRSSASTSPRIWGRARPGPRAGGRPVRRRLPRRWQRARHPARPAELRRRRRRGGGCDRVRARARGRPRRAMPRRTASSGRRSSTTATASTSMSSRRAASPTPRPPRCRRWSEPASRRISSAATSRSTRRPSRSRRAVAVELVDPYGGRDDLRARDDPRSARRVVCRRPDAHLPRRALREPLRLSDGRGDGGARPRVGRGRVHRASLGRPPARGADRAVRGRAARAASVIRLGELGVATALHPRLAADEEAAALFDGCASSTGTTRSTFRTWRSAWPCSARRLSPDELHGVSRRAQPAQARRAPHRRRRRRRPAPRGAAARRRPDRGRGCRARRARPSRRAAAGARARRSGRAPRVLRAAPATSSCISAEPSWQSSAWGESPREGEILAELRRRKLNGEIDGANRSWRRHGS